MNRCSQCTLAHYLHMMVSAAVDCHFVPSTECGDMSPLWEFWNWSAETKISKRRRVAALQCPWF